MATPIELPDDINDVTFEQLEAESEAKFLFLL